MKGEKIKKGRCIMIINVEQRRERQTRSRSSAEGPPRRVEPLPPLDYRSITVAGQKCK